MYGYREDESDYEMIKGVSKAADAGGDIFGYAKGALGIQKGMLGIAKDMRELQGPSPREKFNAQQEQFQITKMFEMFTSLAKEKDLSEPSRDVLRGMMANVYHGLPKMLQAGLAPWMTADFLSKEQMAEREFERVTAKVDKPRGPDGAILERTAVNRLEWLQHDMLLRERERNKRMVMFGKEKGEAMVPMPEFWDASTADDAPGDVWLGYKDKLTQQIGVMNMEKVNVAGLKQALDKGWSTWAQFLRDGKYAELEPQFGVVDGMRVQTTTRFNTLTGQRELETFPVGATSAEVDRSLPDEIKAAMFAVNSGDPDTYLKGVKNPTTLAIANAMKEIEKLEAFQTKDGEAVENPEFWGRMGNLQRMIEQAWPGVHWQAFQRSDFEQGTWNANAPAWLGGGGFMLGEGKWFFKRLDKKVNFQDLRGKSGTLYWDSARQVAFDKYGEDVPESQGLAEGTVLQTTFNKKPGELSEDQEWAQRTAWESEDLAEGTVMGRPSTLPGKRQGNVPVGGWERGVYPEKIGAGLAQDAGRMVKLYMDAFNNQGEAAAKRVVEGLVDRGGGANVMGQSAENIANVTGYLLEDVKKFLREVQVAYRKGREDK